MKVIEATLENVDAVAKLFNLYRQFYQQEDDLLGAKEFIKQRIALNESIVLLAVSPEGVAVGFTQLYPSFSSIAMKPMLHLNDLFVISAKRQSGIGKALIDAACDKAVELGANSLALSTQVNNVSAKSLYESNGFSKVTAFDHYSRQITN